MIADEIEMVRLLAQSKSLHGGSIDACIVLVLAERAKSFYDLLATLDDRGGLGLEVHTEIRKMLGIKNGAL